MSDVPVINPETNEAHLVPEEQVPDALAAGGKRATKMMNPATSQAHYIPDEQVDAARKAGGVLMGASPAAPKVDMKLDTRGPLQITGEGKGIVAGVARAASNTLGVLPGMDSEY